MKAKNKDLISNDGVDNQLKQKFDHFKNQTPSLASFINEFIGSFLSPKTKKAYLRDLSDFFSFLKLGGVKVQGPGDIKSHHFFLYRDELIERKLTPATINRKLVAVRSFMKWSLALKLIDHNPLDALKLPKVTTTSPTLAFSDEETRQLINSPDITKKYEHPHRLILVLLFHLGLRRSELVNIRLEDIYEDRNHLILKIMGKGQKERMLPLSPYLKNEINDYLRRLENLNHLNLQDDDYLIQSKKSLTTNNPVDGSSIYRVVQKYAKRCHINKKVGAHSCRATVISHLLDTQHTPIRDVADFAGHNNITTTERYDKKRKGLDQSAAYHVKFDED